MMRASYAETIGGNAGSPSDYAVFTVGLNLSHLSRQPCMNQVHARRSPVSLPTVGHEGANCAPSS